MQYSLAQHSVSGTRTRNEDRVQCAERDNAVLMVIADGLGGYEGGDLAAETVTEVMLSSFERARGQRFRDPATFLVLSMSYAHTVINQRAKAAGIPVAQPRTTCVACLVQNGLAYWAHIGDSRLYYVRNGAVVLRTNDHSTTEQFIDGLDLPDLDSRSDPGRLLRCVGGNRRHEVTLGPETQLTRNDTIILCTDGIWRVLEERHLEKCADYKRLDDAVIDLSALAERRAGNDCDNVTVCMFRWEDESMAVRPLYGLSIPEVQQERLWAPMQAGGHARKPRKGGATSRYEKRDIDLTIEEIETFVAEMDGGLQDRQ